MISELWRKFDLLIFFVLIIVNKEKREKLKVKFIRPPNNFFLAPPL